MDFSILSMEIEGHIALITINRPEALNALNSAFFIEMEACLDRLETDKSVRVLVITGAGKAFVAGADISEMSGMDSMQGTEFSKRGQEIFSRIENLPVPVIAAVNGFALGGGCELALACDIRLASAKARFGQPEVNLGLIPGYAGTQRLPRIAGQGNAMFMILSGEMVGAAEAKEMGLVQKVYEPEELMTASMNLARLIASKGPVAVKEAKRVIRSGLVTSFNKGCDSEMKAFGNLFGNGESGEGMSAFLEKRKPEW